MSWMDNPEIIGLLKSINQKVEKVDRYMEEQGISIPSAPARESGFKRAKRASGTGPGKTRPPKLRTIQGGLSRPGIQNEHLSPAFKVFLREKGESNRGEGT